MISIFVIEYNSLGEINSFVESVQEHIQDDYEL